MSISQNRKSALISPPTPLLLVLLLLSLSPISSTSDTPTAYEVLQTFNFPPGLLPKGVTSYELDESTGKFAAYMNDSCGFSLEGSYQLDYKSAIRGYISNNKLASLEGVQVKLWFIWVDIVEVYRSGENLDFSVGIASAGFPIDNFIESPQCGCGLDCDDVKGNESEISMSRVESY